MKPNPIHDLYFDEPVSRWDEAIPLGNGQTGCLVWGDGAPQHFSLDKYDLWDKRVAPETLAEDFKYEELIKLVKNKDLAAIRKRFSDFYIRPTPTKIPCARLELDYGKSSRSVESRLSLYNAEAEVKLVFGDKCSVVRTFLHAMDFIGFISISGDAEIPEIVMKGHDFHYPDGEGGSFVPPDSPDFDCAAQYENWIINLKDLGYPSASTGRDGIFTWICQDTCQDLEFAVVAARRVLGAGSCEIAYIVASSLDGPGWFEDAKNKVRAAVDKGYEQALSGHGEWWSGYWGKSSICLPDQEMENLWYINTYLFGSCSRKGFPPMPLQGVWTEDEGTLPSWKGDYHGDMNLQMSYLHYMKANHLEEGESYIDYLWSLLPKARKFASEFFSAPGISLPGTMDTDGRPLSGWPQYTMNLVNQAWYSQAFVNHWLFTGDIDFLRDKAYYFLKESAECILHWLKPGSDGKLLLPLSSSPEIHDGELESWLTPNSNYDLSLLMYLFKNLADMAKVLDNGESGRWEEKLSLLPDLAVNEGGVLMLSPDESLQVTHRHFSHAMSIYPLNLLDYTTGGRDRDIINATVTNLEYLGTGLWVGFSFPWMAAFYAKQGNGEGAAYQLKIFRDTFCSQNGFNLNGDYKNRGTSLLHYRPFTLEANMIAADAIQEMLLQTYDGVIRVFPAIPDLWAKKGASFEDFRGEGGILISAEIRDRAVQYISLKAEKKGSFKVLNKFGSEKLMIARGPEKQVIECRQDEVFVVELEKGETCRVEG